MKLRNNKWKKNPNCVVVLIKEKQQQGHKKKMN